MADKIELRMNLAAIKRIDPYAKDIVDSSAHVAFYTFNSDENEWEKTDVEGAFFIYSRNAEPFHSIFINNRINTNSFVEPITGHLELQSQPPFLLYRNERSRIRGFWFYNSSECDRIGELVRRLIRDCEAKIKGNAPKNIDVIIPANNHINIFTMLSKAQEDFNNSQVHPSIFSAGMVIAPKSENRVLIPIAPSSIQADVASQSVMNFFAAAKPAAASEVPLFQRLLSNPVSVDQIEKQQRAATPQDGRTSPIVNSGIDNGISYMRVQSPKLQNAADMSTSPLAKFIGTSNLGLVGNAKGIIGGINSIDLDLHQKPLQQLLKKENNTFVGAPTIQNQINISTGGKPALMPPTMFQSSASSGPHDLNATNKILTVSLKDSQQQNAAMANKPEPLTQTQLLQAMNYLIKNDPEFIKKLHEAYLKSFTDMVSL